ncbi:MAG: aminopeptidase [Bacteroidetes bacterium]|jgi:predicted aminopeptidase|nr:aminopeptidase [Bacteroidota bacterium]
MNAAIRWIRLFLSYGLFTLFIILAFNSGTVIYLCYQASGQFKVLANTTFIEEFRQSNRLSPTEEQNLALIETVKKYSVDSLSYKTTDNFTTIYDQKNAPILWVITVCEPYELKAIQWNFPLVGSVSYKGFFRKDLAEKEYNHYRANGYDVELRSVSAWSTLGWFKDPVLSSMLKRSKGSICNLLFHELFHATYYGKSSVNFNENIASFVAHKATIQFLARDTTALNEYLFSMEDNKRYKEFMLRQKDLLQHEYTAIKNKPGKFILKQKFLLRIIDSLRTFPVRDPKIFEARKNRILADKNAYFIDFEQYDSMQDSLEKVFNNIYRRNLKKMVQDLKQNLSNY